MCKYMRTYICYYTYMYDRTFVPSNVHMCIYNYICNNPTIDISKLV